MNKEMTRREDLRESARIRAFARAEWHWTFVGMLMCFGRTEVNTLEELVQIRAGLSHLHQRERARRAQERAEHARRAPERLDLETSGGR